MQHHHKPSPFTMEEYTPRGPSPTGRVGAWEQEGKPQKIRFRLPIADMFVLLKYIGIGIFSWFHRRKWPLLRLRSGVFIPKNLPTGHTLEHLVGRFQKTVGSALLGRRMAYLYAVLYEPDLVLPYIDVPWLAEQVAADNLANNTALFHCVAMVEAAIEGQRFADSPANTLASYLRGKFKHARWLWPPSPLAWKKHFLNHYIETLFG